MNNLNQLELALLDPSNTQLDMYLEVASCDEIKRHIEDIRKKAALSTPAGELREKVLAALAS